MNDMKRVDLVVKALEPELKELAHYIHDNPELGLQEFKACKAQAELLRKHGFEVKENVYGLETAYEAIYKGKKDGPKIAMLAEYDALPEIGHGCGHNLIAMVAVGSGIALKDFADEYGGEIRVIGTPAEETLGGKVVMANAGAFDDLDVAMMSHPMDVNQDCMGTMAMRPYVFKFYGKTAHAAATPYEGINALDAMINFFCMMNALRQQTKDDARIHGVIKKGGEAANVIPDYTEADVYVRANKADYNLELAEKVIRCAEAAALGTGCRMEYEQVEENFKDTIVNHSLSALNTEMMEKLGVTVTRAGDKIIPGSSDMGDVSYCCPAIQNLFDIDEGEKLGSHTRELAAKAGTDRAMDLGLVYVRGHVMTAIELMRNPEKLAEIKAEFERTK